MDTLDTRIGLANIGNTCFLNVILQILRLNPAISCLFLREDLTLRNESKKKQLLYGIQTLVRDFWRTAPKNNERPVLVPRGFFQALHNCIRECDDDWYSPGQQADAAEAFQYLIEGIHDAIYRSVTMNINGKFTNQEEHSQQKAIESWISFFKKEYSPIITNFYGQTQIQIVCESCKNVSERYEPWFMIKAPIPGADTVGITAPDLDKCISAAFKSEVIDDYYCEKCKDKKRATIHNRISRFPQYLCLSLKRFTNNSRKIRGLISWDLDSVDFSSVAAFCRDPFGSSFHTEYQTISVVEHIGSLQGGHYHMYSRQNEKWYNYDDNSVSQVNPDRIVNEDSYILVMVPKAEIHKIYKLQETHIEAWRKSQPPQ
jgi:ubiquitin carboxyl-terminal hydrolase 22/27/51